MPSAGYSQVATTIAQLKAITPANRVQNFSLFLPVTGSWYYYDETSTETPDDLTIVQPDDGVGRWRATSLQIMLAVANSTANGVANSAISSHTSAVDPHTQYHRRDGVLVANQPNASTPAVSVRVATGNAGNAGGVQVLTSAGSPAVSLGADTGNRGVITAGNNGLMVGGSPNERLGFFGGNGGTLVTRPNAIAAPGNNTTDTRRAVLDIRSTLIALGLIAP